MEVRNTQQRLEVAAIHRWSVAQVRLGLLEESPNWDADSPWHNSRFRDPASGQAWVVYVADHAWSGEVRLLDGRAPE